MVDANELKAVFGSASDKQDVADEMWEDLVKEADINDDN